MALCKKCGALKLTEQPCARCGAAENAVEAGQGGSSNRPDLALGGEPPIITDDKKSTPASKTMALAPSRSGNCTGPVGGISLTSYWQAGVIASGSTLEEWLNTWRLARGQSGG
jgi:hypothetical protein